MASEGEATGKQFLSREFLLHTRAKMESSDKGKGIEVKVRIFSFNACF
jgi:hypothetical protein